MNFNNHKIRNFMNTNNLKALFMGILLMAATFLVTNSIANGPTIAFAQEHGVIVSISKLPNQTVDASTQLTVSNIDPGHSSGRADINIPGIGSGSVVVDSQIQNDNPIIDISVFHLPGQTAQSDTLIHAYIGQELSVPIDIPGIGSGTLSLSSP